MKLFNNTFQSLFFNRIELVLSENSYKVRILVTKGLFVQSEFVQSEGRTKRGIAVLIYKIPTILQQQHHPKKRLNFSFSQNQLH